MNRIERWIRIFRWLWWGCPMVIYEGYWCGCCGKHWSELLVIPTFNSYGEWWDTWYLCPKNEECRKRDSLPEPAQNAETDNATFMGMDKATELVREKIDSLPEPGKGGK